MKVIVNGETIMKIKRHLTMTIDECFSFFKEGYPNMKIGWTFDIIYFGIIIIHYYV